MRSITALAAGRFNSQKALQIGLVFKPQVQRATQRCKLMGFDRADLPGVTAVKNPALWIEAPAGGFVRRKVLQGRP